MDSLLCLTGTPCFFVYSGLSRLILFHYADVSLAGRQASHVFDQIFFLLLSRKCTSLRKGKGVQALCAFHCYFNWRGVDHYDLHFTNQGAVCLTAESFQTADNLHFCSTLVHFASAL